MLIPPMTTGLTKISQIWNEQNVLMHIGSKVSQNIKFVLNECLITENERQLQPNRTHTISYSSIMQLKLNVISST